MAGNGDNAIDPFDTVDEAKGVRVYSPGDGVNALDVVLSDSDDNILRNSDKAPVIGKAFFLTVQADISVVCKDKSILTCPALPAYTRIDCRARRIRSSGTSAAPSTIKIIL